MAGWSLGKHLLPFLAYSWASEPFLFLSLVIYWTPSPQRCHCQYWHCGTCGDGAQSVCVCAWVCTHLTVRPVGVQAHQAAFDGWTRLKHAALGGFMALDYPGAVGLGHAPILHRRSLGERQWAPGAVQSGALQDLGQAREAEAAEWRPAPHGRIAQVTTSCMFIRAVTTPTFFKEAPLAFTPVTSLCGIK